MNFEINATIITANSEKSFKRKLRKQLSKIKKGKNVEVTKMFYALITSTS